MMTTANNPSLLRNPSGFTLIEVMITLVVIAIAAALASPAFLAMAPGMQLRGAAQDLFSGIQEAKILAIKENKSVGIRIGTAGYTIGEPFTDTNGDGLYTPVEAYTDTDGDGSYTEHKVVKFAEDYDHGIGLLDNADPDTVVTADWNGAACATPGNPCHTPEASVTFNSRGTANPDSAFIVNKNKDVCYGATVMTAGAVKLRKYDGASPFNQDNWHE